MEGKGRRGEGEVVVFSVMWLGRYDSGGEGIVRRRKSGGEGTRQGASRFGGVAVTSSTS